MIFKKIRKAVKENKYLLIKKAIRLETFRLDFNFDTMLALWSKNNTLHFESKLNQFVGQINNVNHLSIFKPFISYVETNLKDLFEIGKLDFFYSLKGEVGPSHLDKEHVIILGVKNITYYHLDNKDFKVEPGDILYIPKNYLHHAFSARERIVLSLSIWKKD
jgi:hypothetical protein|tara:strand:+ start:135 stop:620 length:486 start_codon:yes stop_codon:yes gene_type:complete